MSDTARSITIANDVSLCEFIASANHRLIVFVPAVSSAVAKAICERWENLGAHAVNVILDIDPSVYRLGYGDETGLNLLVKTARQLNTELHRQTGIRIGLIISDDETMAYSPTPQLIEAGSEHPEAPNAIHFGSTPEELERELGEGPNGTDDQIIGKETASDGDIDEVQKDLDDNPPQKFDIVRKVNVFNAYFEFVEFELKGTYLNRKTIPIPSHLMGVADEDAKQKLRTSFRLVDKGDELSGEHLEKDKALIVKKYLKILKGYGSVILRTKKDDFRTEITELKAAVVEFSKEVKETLQKRIDERREALVEALFPAIKQNPPKDWIKSDGKRPDDATLRQFLEDDLRRAFGTADRLIRQMEVKCLFKGVTYESLQDENFIDIAQKAIPELKDLYNEYDAAKGRSDVQISMFV